MRVCLADDSSGVCGLGEEYVWVWVSAGGVWVSGVRWVWVSGGDVCGCLGEVCVGVWGRWVWVSGGGVCGCLGEMGVGVWGRSARGIYFLL